MSKLPNKNLQHFFKFRNCDNVLAIMSKRAFGHVESEEFPPSLNIPGTSVPDVPFMVQLSLSGHVKAGRMTAAAMSVLAWRVSGRLKESHAAFVKRCDKLWNNAPVTFVHNGVLEPMVEQLWLASRFRKGVDPFNISVGKRRELGTYGRKTHGLYLKHVQKADNPRCCSAHHGTRTGFVDHLNGTFLPTCNECKRDADCGVLLPGHAALQSIASVPSCIAHVNLKAYLAPEVALALMCLQEASACKGEAFACTVPVDKLHFFGSVVRANAHTFNLRFGPGAFALTTFGTAVKAQTKTFPVLVARDIARLLRTATLCGAAVIDADVVVARFPAIVERCNAQVRAANVPILYKLADCYGVKMLIDMAYAQLVAMMKGPIEGSDDNAFLHQFRIVVTERRAEERAVPKMTAAFVDAIGNVGSEKCDMHGCNAPRHHADTNMCSEHSELCAQPYCSLKAAKGDLCKYHAGSYWFTMTIENIHLLDTCMLLDAIKRGLQRIKTEKLKRVRTDALELKKTLRMSDRDFKPVLAHIEAHRMSQASRVTWTLAGNPFARPTIAPVIRTQLAPKDDATLVHVSDGTFQSVLPLLVAAANETSSKWNKNLSYIDELDVYTTQRGVEVQAYKKASKVNSALEHAEFASAVFNEVSSNWAKSGAPATPVYDAYKMFA